MDEGKVWDALAAAQLDEIVSELFTDFIHLLVITVSVFLAVNVKD